MPNCSQKQRCLGHPEAHRPRNACAFSTEPESTAVRRANSSPPSRFIRIFGQITQQLNERWRLADEESHSRQEIHHAHRDTLGLRGANDRTWREVSTEEWAWLRHDQVGLKVLATKRRRI